MVLHAIQHRRLEHETPLGWGGSKVLWDRNPGSRSNAKLCLTLCDPMNCRQHARLPCPSPSPGVCSNSCPLSQWYHPAISSSVTLFSFCLQSFPASGSFPMSQIFTSGGQSIEVSASASVLPINSPTGLQVGQRKPRGLTRGLQSAPWSMYVFPPVSFPASLILAHFAPATLASTLLFTQA